MKEFDADPYIAELFPWDFRVRSRGKQYSVRPLRMGDALALERLAARADRLKDREKVIEESRAADVAGAPVPDSVAALDEATASFEEGLRKFVGSLVPDLLPPASEWPIKALRALVDDLVDYWGEYTKKNSTSPITTATEAAGTIGATEKAG